MLETNYITLYILPCTTERAGYSLEELFMYARSSVVKQRQLSLSVLSAMLTKLSQGYYHRCFDAPFLQLLVSYTLVMENFLYAFHEIPSSIYIYKLQ